MEKAEQKIVTYSTWEQELRPLSDEEIAEIDRERRAMEWSLKFQWQRLSCAVKCAWAEFKHEMRAF